MKTFMFSTTEGFSDSVRFAKAFVAATVGGAFRMMKRLLSEFAHHRDGFRGRRPC